MMTDAWFVLILVVGMVTFAGTLFVYWIRNTVTAQGERQELNASDLRLMEETVQTLIDRLKAATDEAVSAIDARQTALEDLLDRVDKRLPSEESAEMVARLAQNGVEDAEIAQRAGITRGEVELLLELQATRANRA